MTSRAVSRALVACGVGLLAGACMMPSERSGSLRVVVANAPTLMRVQESVHLSASLQDASGKVVPGAALRFLTSDNPKIVSVDSTGLLVAEKAGQAAVQVTSAAFAGAQPGNLSIRVVGLLAIDSVRPRSVKFGQRLQVYGVGLSPDSVTGVTLGGANAAVGTFTAANLARPDLVGVLNVWAAPPAPSVSFLRVESGFASQTGSDTIHVGQDDIYEPNDSVSASLVMVSDSFFNPGLAEEARGNVKGVSFGPTMDWYAFTTTTTRDMTVVLSAPTGLLDAEVVLADSLGLGLVWSGSGHPVHSVVPAPRLLATTPFLETCGTSLSSTVWMTGYGLAGAPADSIVLPLRGLPAGRHHLLILYGDKWFTSELASGTQVIGFYAVPKPVGNFGFSFSPLAGYRLLVRPGYRSALAADQFEPNNHCGLAATLTVPSSYTNLTLDNPGRNDWYKFTAATAGKTYTFTLDGSVSTADIDLYLYQSFLPDSLHFVAGGFTGTPHEVVSAVLPAGNYFLVVADFAGVPTLYSLTSGSVAAAAAAPAAPTPTALPSKLRALRDRLRSLVHAAGAGRVER